MVDLAEKYKNQIQWAFKPHPWLYSSLCKLEDWGEDRTNAYFKKWADLEYTQFEHGAYADLFASSDAIIIHDCGSFLVEYLYTRNPALYLTLPNTNRSYNEVGRKALDCYYQGVEKEDIERFIEDVVLAGNDSKRADRNVFHQKYLLPPHGQTAAQNVLAEIESGFGWNVSHATLESDGLSRSIGILTQINSCNYGGVLQGFALAIVLRKMGIHAEQINYWFSNKNKDLWGLLSKAKSPLSFAFWYILSIFKFKSLAAAKASLARSRASAAFLKDFVPLSARTYKDRNALSGLSAQGGGYSHVIVGSDQVWNPKVFSVPNPFLLENVKDVKKLAYAASVGMLQLPPERVSEYREALQSFQAISLREHVNVPEFQSLVPCSVVGMLDPSLLLSAEDWREALHLRVQERNNEVFIYWLGDLEPLAQIVTQLKKQGQLCRVFSVPQILRKRIKGYRSAYQFLKKEEIPLCLEADPRAFVAAIASAKAVISDSFHAMMFSAIFQTPCKIVIESERGRHDMGIRMTDFLSHYVANYPVVQTVSEMGRVDEFESVRLTTEFVHAKKSALEWLQTQLGVN